MEYSINNQDVKSLGHVIYLVEHYGYFGIIIALVGGIIGLPVPDEVLLTYVGYNVFQGKMAFMPSLLSASSGAIAGITLSYFLGIKFGLPLLHKFGPRFHITNGRIEKTKILFSKFGPYLLFIGYFIPGVRHLTAYLAGINSFSYKKFSLFAYSGAILWSFFFITLGKVLGGKWHYVLLYLTKYKMVILPAAALLFIITTVIYWRKRRGTAKTNQVFE